MIYFISPICFCFVLFFVLVEIKTRHWMSIYWKSQDAVLKIWCPLKDSVFQLRTKINKHERGSYSVIYRNVNWTQEICLDHLLAFFSPGVSQTGNNLGFAGHTISIASSQFRHCSVKVAINDMWMNEEAVLTCYYQKQVSSWHQPTGCQLLTPVLDFALVSHGG